MLPENTSSSETTDGVSKVLTAPPLAESSTYETTAVGTCPQRGYPSGNLSKASLILRSSGIKSFLSMNLLESLLRLEVYNEGAKIDQSSQGHTN